MNLQYIYNNGKVTVVDHNGNLITLDYYDKLKEVLEQENLIEILNHKKWQLIGKKKDYERQYENIIKTQRKGLKLIGLLSIGVVAIGLLLPKILGLPMIESLKIILPMLPIISVLTLMGVISDIKEKKYILERKKKTEEALSKLEKQLELQKQHLEDLEKDKTITREKDGFSVSKLNGGLTVMHGREDLVEFIELYDISDMLIYNYHLNRDYNGNSDFICDDENIDEKGHAFQKTLK